MPHGQGVCGILYIPENECGIREGYYTIQDLVKLLRERCGDRDAVHFIADMLED